MVENNNNHRLKPLKWYKGLATIKGRLETGAFLIEGDRAIQQIVRNHPDAVTEIVTIEKPGIAYQKYPVRVVTESQFRSICATKTPQGMLAVIRMPDDVYTYQLPENCGNRILLLEDIQDPGNVGTIIRTAAAFNYSGIVLSEKSADPFSPKCVQSTAGSILELWLRRTSQYLELVQSLKKNGYLLVATDLSGRGSPSAICHQKKLVLALGNEASGLSPAVLELAGHRLKIPITRDKAESLNVAVSGAILMYLSTSQDE